MKIELPVSTAKAWSPRNIVGWLCAPIGKVPPHYGEGLYSTAAALMDGAMKTLPAFSGGAK